MGFADAYFSKQKGFKPCFYENPSEKLSFVVVIPAYLEPDLITALDSLLKCEPPEGHVEVIVVFNMPENAAPDVISFSERVAKETSEWIQKNTAPEFRFLVIKDLMMPARDAGVGLARKTGMDQALYRFNRLNRPDGIILSFDADCRCDPGYFRAIGETMTKHPLTNGFTLYFEHPVSGNEYPDLVYRGIADYELHLRILNLFTRFTGFPHAYHTVGSCFGVTANAYAREGGMNKKKAGEDFYFMHKIIPLGEFREINNTCIIPSPRESGRVPFGTGAAMRKYLASGGPDMLTYAPACFHDLKSFLRLAGSFYSMDPGQTSSTIDELPVSIKNYLHEIHAVDSIQEIRENSGSLNSFKNRFFRWFDAFRIIKYLNFASRNFYEKVTVREAAEAYLNETGHSYRTGGTDNIELLNILRDLEKNPN